MPLSDDLIETRLRRFRATAPPDDLRGACLAPATAPLVYPLEWMSLAVTMFVLIGLSIGVTAEQRRVVALCGHLVTEREEHVRAVAEEIGGDRFAYQAAERYVAAITREARGLQ